MGPAPELVRQREAKWIDILAQWDRILLKKTSKVCARKGNTGYWLLPKNTENEGSHLMQIVCYQKAILAFKMTLVICHCLDIPPGQGAVSERHPSLTQGKVLASAVWSCRQAEKKRKPVQGKRPKCHLIL